MFFPGISEAGWTAGIRSRIRVAAGDLSLPCLGMEEREWKALADEVDGIYHSAADVRHYAADAGEFMNTNVTGTENHDRTFPAGRCCASLYIHGQHQR